MKLLRKLKNVCLSRTFIKRQIEQTTHEIVSTHNQILLDAIEKDKEIILIQLQQGIKELQQGIKELRQDIKEESRNLLNAIDYRLEAFSSQDPIVIAPWIIFKENKLVHRNIGDELNCYLISELSKQPVIPKGQMTLSNAHKEILAIGSILQCSVTPYSIVWGTGLIAKDTKPSAKPLEVRAVRGPLTREILEKEGVTCPEVYGDPALLLPLVYTPKSHKKYKIGIIPHYIDYELEHLQTFFSLHPEILFIKVSGYEDWRDVIEDINSCECIVSSSLHGLIFADAYSIPNCLAFFSDNIVGGEFKYRDYFSGVSRQWVTPIDFKREIFIDAISDAISNYVPIKFNPDTLLSCCPFDLKERYLAYKK